MLKTLRREAARDRRAVNRFLTQNRLVATVKHEGIPKNIDAGEIDGTFYVAYEHIDAQPLSARFSRTGPSHINELRPILRGMLDALAALHKAQLSHGDLKMDLESRTLFRNSAQVHLTPTEWDLLRVLMSNAGKTLTHRQLFSTVWAGRQFGDAQQYLRVHIANVRRKIETNPLDPKYIITEPGVGYRFATPAHQRP